eukprot:m.47631 g.47631  ORF g.47631 m.47631 type:complete len:116 (+) comp47599_c0_seq1:256-603(+)
MTSAVCPDTCDRRTALPLPRYASVPSDSCILDAQLFQEVKQHGKDVNKFNNQFDFNYFHVSPTPASARPMNESIKFFQTVIEKPRIFSMFRDPLSHIISSLCFFNFVENVDQLHG